ncbi:hypothetical protein ABK040_009510 [Willaertia magna]
MGIANSRLHTLVESLSLEKLETGLTREEAEKIWEEADKNHDGTLDENEAKDLLKDLNLSAIHKLKTALEDLEVHLQSEQVLKDWMKECQNTEGKITKEDLIKVLMTGHAVDSIPKVLLEGFHSIEKKRKSKEEDEAVVDEKKEEEKEEEPNKKKVKSD